MARTLALLAGSLLLLSTVAYADEDAADVATEEKPAFSPRTLTGSDRVSHQFSSPILKATWVDGRGAMLVGGRGAALFKHQWGLGGGGFTLVSGDGKRTLSYGGPAVNYIFFPESVVHFDVSLMLAWGRASGPDTVSHGVFLVEPEVNLEVNVARSFRIALGVGYRHVADRGSLLAGSPGLSGAVFGFGLRFGNF